jgi:hypothetical protein
MGGIQSTQGGREHNADGDDGWVLTRRISVIDFEDGQSVVRCTNVHILAHRKTKDRECPVCGEANLADVDPVFISGHDDPMLPIVLIHSQAYCFIDINLWS